MWSTFTASVACIKWLLALLLVTLNTLVLCPISVLSQQTTAPIAPQQTPNEIGSEILHRALHEAVWGPPTICTVRQSIKLFDKQLSGFGKLVRAGEGSGKLKYTLQMPAGNFMNSLFQISDGQLLHTIEDIGGVRKRTIVDLDKIRKRLVIDNKSVFDPVVAMYLAVGGQAECIRKLCQQYEWYDVRAGLHAEMEVWILSGRLAAVPPAIRALSATDIALSNPNQSAMLPTVARVVVGKANSEIAYWLHQVEQRRTLDEVSPSNNRADLYLVTEWLDPLREKVDPRHFEPSSNNDPFSDETEKYLPPPPNMARIPNSQPWHLPANR